jgi:phosphoribosylformylglycinamidine synthase II
LWNPNLERVKTLNEEVLKKFSLSLSEYEIIVKSIGREPNETEFYIFSAMWSEHCGYKHSKRLIKEHFKPSEENAGVVWIGDIGIAFKVESHNHPCAVEPFQGAATGVGGIIRDVIAMGARPIATLDSLHFGNPTSSLFEGVVEGISSYGNSIGVPTVGGETRFDSSYENNPLVNVMAVGTVKKGKVKSARANECGSVVMIGSKTGRDGLHGASFASRELEGDGKDRPSVQVGDPFAEKRLIEATLQIVELNSVLAVQDMGAAGILSSTTEVAARSGMGLKIYTDRVPLREEKMKAWEILLSESQERMTFLVKKGHEKEVEEIAKRWELEFAIIGETDDSDLLRVYHNGEKMAVLPLNLVTNAPDLSREVENSYPVCDEKSRWNKREVKKDLLKLLSNPTISSKRYVFERYDHTVRGETIKSPGSDAAVIHINGDKAIALSLDGNVRYTALNPLEGTKALLFESCANVISSGGKALGITNCLNFGNPEENDVAAQFYACIKGLEEASEMLDIPITGGNVSFYNQSKDLSIPLSPVIGVVGVIEDWRKIPKSGFVNSGDLIYLLGKRDVPKNGGSLYLSEKETEKKVFPKVDWNECKDVLSTTYAAIVEELCVAVHDVSEGGVMVALAEMVMNGVKGANVKYAFHPFEEYPSRFVVEVSKENAKNLEKLLKERNVEFALLGSVCDGDLIFNGEHISVKEMKMAYENAVNAGEGA